MTLPKLIVFDMDGVLIDVSGSYRETVRKTARLFFEGASGFGELPDPLFPLSDLGELKQTGGLNNDWDLTAMTLHLLFAKVKTTTDPLPHHDSAEYGEPLRGRDVTALAEFLKGTPSPLMDLLDRCGRRNDPYVTGLYRGDVCSGNRIKRIFQEVYLGSPLFRALYGQEPRFHRGEGLIHQESLLIDRTLLAALSREHILAIATGRPRAEADYPLDHFDLRPYFRTVITLDDCTEEEERLFLKNGERVSLQKPDPYMLDLIPRRIGSGFSGCYYVGDMPDDMQAAKSSKSGFCGVGVLLSSADPENRRKALLRAGAEFVIDDYASMPEILD